MRSSNQKSAPSKRVLRLKWQNGRERRLLYVHCSTNNSRNWCYSKAEWNLPAHPRVIPPCRYIWEVSSIGNKLHGSYWFGYYRSKTIDEAIGNLKDCLIHSVVLSKQNNWVFITQFEAYYHDKDVGDVAQVNENDTRSQQLEIDMVKCQEGRGSWQELRCRLNKIEMIVTGWLLQQKQQKKKNGSLSQCCSAFRNSFHLVRPCNINYKSLSCTRMLRTTRKMQVWSNGVSNQLCLQTWNSLRQTNLNSIIQHQSVMCIYVQVWSHWLLMENSRKPKSKN